MTPKNGINHDNHFWLHFCIAKLTKVNSPCYRVQCCKPVYFVSVLTNSLYNILWLINFIYSNCLLNQLIMHETFLNPPPPPPSMGFDGDSFHHSPDTQQHPYLESAI